jgi:mRNA interferase MazF
MAGRLARGEVRICAFAAPDKKRPVVVITRDSSLEFLAAATVVPITSTIRGVKSEVILDESDGMKVQCAANLHNTTTVSKDRLGRRVAQLSSERMAEVCAALGYSFGCDFTGDSPSVLH